MSTWLWAVIKEMLLFVVVVMLLTLAGALAGCDFWERVVLLCEDPSRLVTSK